MGTRPIGRETFENMLRGKRGIYSKTSYRAGLGGAKENYLVSKIVSFYISFKELIEDYKCPCTCIECPLNCSNHDYFDGEYGEKKYHMCEEAFWKEHPDRIPEILKIIGAEWIPSTTAYIVGEPKETAKPEPVVDEKRLEQAAENLKPIRISLPKSRKTGRSRRRGG